MNLYKMRIIIVLPQKMVVRIKQVNLSSTENSTQDTIIPT